MDGADGSFGELLTRRRSALNRVRVDLALLGGFLLLGVAPLAWWGVALGKYWDLYPDFLA